MTNHKSKARELANKHWEMYGYSKYNPKTLAEMIEPALREAEISGARKMQEKLAKLTEVQEMDVYEEDHFGEVECELSDFPKDFAKAIRALSPESVVEG